VLTVEAGSRGQVCCVATGSTSTAGRPSCRIRAARSPRAPGRVRSQWR